MDPRTYWDSVYLTKSPTDVSWFQPAPVRSLELIRRVAPNLRTPIIDVGGGASVLTGALQRDGYSNLTVLDLSRAALATTQARLGAKAAQVRWLEADVRTASIPNAEFGVWHDRAVFHFLTLDTDRAAYVAQMKRAVRPGGYVVVSTFGPEGPKRCSGLEVCRYSPTSLHREFGPGFRLLSSEEEQHETPSGSHQAFIYCLFSWEGNPS